MLQVRRDVVQSVVVEIQVTGVAGVNVATGGDLCVTSRADNLFDLVDDLPGVVDPELALQKSLQRTKGDQRVDTSNDDDNKEEGGNQEAFGSSRHG